MTELERELQSIFDKRKKEYQAVYISSVGLHEAKADNARNFDRINNEFVDEIIASANEYIGKNPSVSQAEAEENIKKLIPKFSRLMISPYD